MSEPGRSIVIGEGVELDTRPAAFPARMVAIGIDLLLLAVVVLIILESMRIFRIRIPYGWWQIVMIIGLVVITVLWQMTIEIMTRGRSLGKVLIGLRVVRDDGGPILPRQAGIRALVGVAELWMTLGAVATITSMFNQHSKRVGDILAGTYVASAKPPKPLEPLPPVRPELAAWAKTADIGLLPDGLALAARQFLGTRSSMEPMSRQAMAQSMARDVGRLVAPLPPHQVHPEEYLAAVLRERSNRDLIQETGRQKLVDAQTRALRSVPFHMADQPQTSSASRIKSQ